MLPIKYHIITVLLLFLQLLCHAQHPGFQDNIYHFIENTSLFEINQVDGHVPLVPYSDFVSALSIKKSESPWYLNLNGTWKFHYSDTPEGVPQNFFKRDYNDKSWSDIPVPSNWEMQGFSDPLFRNIATPFIPNPPRVPREYNPTGAYRREFVLPKSWKDREVFLRFEKVASASFVWINGQEVGYNEGAQEPAEYNITSFLKPGKNTIAVLVLKYSDGYYLEDQDYWRLAGIFDDVSMFATPRVHIFDWHATTDLDEAYRDAFLKVDVLVTNFSHKDSGPQVLTASLIDKNKNIIWTSQSESFSIAAGQKQNKILSGNILNPAKWSAEHPNLYTLVLTLADGAGKITEAISGKIGFKETEIRNRVFMLNGVPLKLNAINSHMQHPENGHVMDEETIIKDLILLKQHNINCVRTSHYPPVSRYLELADEYGMYIIDETGNESHATEYLSGLPEWEAMYRERACRMVLRDRNHPSILFWSAGNESGEGINICHVIEEGKKYDKTRYWMYGGNAFKHPCEEIIGPRYPDPWELITNVFLVPVSEEPRPSFMDEYLAATGNGVGGLDDYMDAIYNHPGSIGGAIWDFVSTGITEKVRIIKDVSGNNIPVHVMGRAKLSNGVIGKGIDLNGHDQWVEVYRDDKLEIDNDQLLLSLWVYPRKLSSSAGTLITKGNYQFGIHQTGKDSLEFYLTCNEKMTVRIALPSNWEYSWHKVEAVYNGSEMYLRIDGVESRKQKISGNILNTPFPVNIGRNAEIHGQETYVYISDAIIDEAGIFRQVLDPGLLINPAEEIKQKAVLWLDFEEIEAGGNFYSYGIGGRTYGTIWPDRTPQPEMLQIKKSGQPVKVSWASADDPEIEITNRFHFTNLNELSIKWILEADGREIASGILEQDLPPGQKDRLLIPVVKPELIPGAEYRLLLSFRLKNANVWAPAGYEVAWEQLELPWFAPPFQKEEIEGSLMVKEEGDSLLVESGQVIYTFLKSKGSIISIQVDKKELLKAGPELNVWRAPLANELDEWTWGASDFSNPRKEFGRMAANEWYSSGLDKMLHYPEHFQWKKTPDGKVRVETREIDVTGNGKGAYMGKLVYTIDSSGTMKMEHTLTPNGSMPSWLPRIGTMWLLDKSLNRVQYYGRGPEENYPDRKTGYKTGVYKTSVEEMYEPYLIPQDYGLRTENRWVRMTDEDGRGLEFSADRLFNFSVHPFTRENLSRSLYTYQLKKADQVTFNLDYATSGVGCTARGVFPEYQVYPQKYSITLFIKPVNVD